MEEQFKYINNIASRYHILSTDVDELYQSLNNLSGEPLDELLEAYSTEDVKYQPVNLLRAECLKIILKGETLNEESVEDIKQRIRDKDISSFKGHEDSYLDQLTNYKETRRDLFANWQQPWTIFHTFFHTGLSKRTVQTYLEQIGDRLLKDLDLPDYKVHSVDFNGSNNFGKDWCWIALYPIQKDSHREAFQFFLRLSKSPEAGLMPGADVENTDTDLKPVHSFEQVLEHFQRVKKEIVSLNNQGLNYFKYAPGPNAKFWQEHYEQGIAAMDFGGLPIKSLNDYKSLNVLNEACGFDSSMNSTWNLWLLKTAKKGDVIFANNGRSICEGIGIVEGDYYYDDKAEDFKHRRKVNWIINKRYTYQSGDIKKYRYLFRTDTFSPTKVHQFLIDEYARISPDYISLFEEHNIPVNKVSLSDTKEAVPVESDDEEGDMNFWWLNANPKIWSLKSMAEGETKSYTTHNEKGNKRRIYKYFEEVKAGDTVIGYETSPIKKIVSILRIERSIHTNHENNEVVSFTKEQDVLFPISWAALQSMPELNSCEVLNNNQGSLFKLNEAEYDIIQALIDEQYIESEKAVEKIQSYSLEDAMRETFLTEEEFQETCDILKYKKNIILQGPPGVGKTYIADKIAKVIMGKDDKSRLSTVQFHQSYSYEDFIQGIRPLANGSGFRLKQGLFMDLCDRARANHDQEYFLIIDEINRGNLSKIFGELMMLIENDKRGQEISLAYAEDGEQFSIPKNLYIIGTMNTADRSLAMVDYALRRRFAFIAMTPNFNKKFSAHLQEQGLEQEPVQTIISRIQDLNKAITSDNSLGRGFEIGHSYFTNYDKKISWEKWYGRIIKNEIAPMIKEYYFDDESTSEALINKLAL